MERAGSPYDRYGEGKNSVTNFHKLRRGPPRGVSATRQELRFACHHNIVEKLDTNGQNRRICYSFKASKFSSKKNWVKKEPREIYSSGSFFVVIIKKRLDISSKSYGEEAITFLTQH